MILGKVAAVAAMALASVAVAGSASADSGREQATDAIQRPDLRPSCVRTAVSDQFWSLQCRIFNIGGAPAPETVTNISFIGADGERHLIMQATRPLLPGQMTLQQPIRIGVGSPFRVQVDAQNQVLEANELNNVQVCPDDSDPMGSKACQVQ